MKRSLLLCGLLALSAAPAHAAQSVMCSPNIAASSLARQVTNPATGALYSLNGQGCAVIGQADIGYFIGQGFSAGPPFGPNILYTTGVLTGTTSVQIGVLPPGSYIQHIIVQNLTANAVTGGIAIGSASGGAQITAALACPANCLVYQTDALILARIFSTTAQQPIFATAVTAWNSANVTITVVYGYY